MFLYEPSPKRTKSPIHEMNNKTPWNLYTRRFGIDGWRPILYRFDSSFLFTTCSTWFTLFAHKIKRGGNEKAVKDLSLTKDMSIGDLVEQMQVSGGFTAKKVFIASWRTSDLSLKMPAFTIASISISWDDEKFLSCILISFLTRTESLSSTIYVREDSHLLDRIDRICRIFFG